MALVEFGDSCANEARHDGSSLGVDGVEIVRTRLDAEGKKDTNELRLALSLSYRGRLYLSFAGSKTLIIDSRIRVQETRDQACFDPILRRF